MLGTVLINCQAGKINKVIDGIKDLKGITDVYSTLGRWDILVRINVSTIKEMDKITILIKTKEGVHDVETLMMKTHR